MPFRTWGLWALIGLAGPAIAHGQEAVPPEVGSVAPDFELTTATREGVLDEPVRLRDFRGRTVVLAFFYRVRTPG